MDSQQAGFATIAHICGRMPFRMSHQDGVCPSSLPPDHHAPVDFRLRAAGDGFIMAEPKIQCLGRQIPKHGILRQRCWRDWAGGSAFEQSGELNFDRR